MSFLSGLFPGDMGITQTVNAMSYAAKFAVMNKPEVRQRAERIVASCIERSEVCEVTKIFNYVLAHYRYLADPTFLEHFKSPEIIDQEISMLGAFQGDCDDVSGYLAGLLMSIGYKMQYVVISIPGQNERFAHVFPQVYMKSRMAWVTLDATARKMPIGWEAPSGRRREYPIN